MHFIDGWIPLVSLNWQKICLRFRTLICRHILHLAVKVVKIITKHCGCLIVNRPFTGVTSFMTIYLIFFGFILLVFYLRLRFIIHRLIILEFISFYIISLFGLNNIVNILGQYFLILIFLIFVLEGVIGIVGLIFQTNHRGSGILLSKSLGLL